MLTSFSMDIETGMWHRNQNMEEHPSTSVPKIVNQITDRTKVIISKVESAIKSSITEIYEHKARIVAFQQEMTKVSNEISTHIRVMNAFTEKVLNLIRIEHCKTLKGHPTARMQLQMVGNLSAFTVDPNETATDQEPITFRPLTEVRDLSKLQERVDHHDALNLLDFAKKRLEKIQNALPRIEICWNTMTSLDRQHDPEKLLTTLQTLKEKLRFLKNDELFNEVYNSFFHIEDATIGLLHVNESECASFDQNQATLKLIKVVQRTYLKGLEYFHKSDEKVLVEKTLERIDQFNVNKIECAHIDALKGVSDLIGIEPSNNPSLPICYRKFGELHANLRQKRFELIGLHYLEEYFPEELKALSITVRSQLKDLHKAFINTHKVTLEERQIHRTALSEENVLELELSAQLLENTLLETEPGREYFTISKKIHDINQIISNKYSNLSDLTSLDMCVEILNSELFKNFVESLTQLMLALRKEQAQNPGKRVNSRDLKMVGITTGKTNNMIETYVDSLEEILAPLSTFMGNTLHALLKDMLKNIPLTEERTRKYVKDAYKLTGTLLRNLEGSLLSNSGLYKR